MSNSLNNNSNNNSRLQKRLNREVDSNNNNNNNNNVNNVNNNIEIGDKYLITWKNGQIHPAKIIACRPSKNEDNNNDTTNNNELEYYVHYINHDRRLDEWVNKNRIDQQTKVENILGDIENHRSKPKKSKRKLEDHGSTLREEKVAILSQLEREHEETTKVKNIQQIELGRYEIDTWYFSAFPEEYCGVDKLYFCEFCLKYMKSETTLRNHRKKCFLTTPPGRQIYLCNNVSMYEIDGKQNPIYCQNLCLLSKLFLDHKTLYYDVDTFLFYILCEVNSIHSNYHHIVGYFSKEKHSAEGNNLACILTFPPYQRNGYGKLLISISYELTKREGTVGSPEKPLSDLGKISYRSYWAYVILNTLNNKNLYEISLQDLIKETGIRYEDIVSTLHALNLIKYWKGQHIISISQHVIDNHLQSNKKMLLCNPECLNWEPTIYQDTKNNSNNNNNGSSNISHVINNSNNINEKSSR